MPGLRLPLCFLLVLLLCCVSVSSIFDAKDPVDGLAACHPSHLQALAQFKSEFDSSGCNQTDYYNGVQCDNTTGAVTKLKLPSGCLSGTLNPNSSLFGFYSLRYLDLSHNDFTSSSLPSSFGNLHRLELLFLSSNGFQGQIPSSFSNLSQLSILSLSHNELSGSFPSIRNLTKLSVLDLSNNRFSTLEPNSSLFSLRHLRYLNLSYNDFTSSSIPSGFGNLNRLEVLLLSSNGFVGQIPSSFNNLSRLSILDLSHNELAGSFPLGWNITKLSLLDLSSNHFSAFESSSSLFGLHNLRYLDLSGNNVISSSLPFEFGNLNKLESLDLSNNGFISPIPSSFNNLSRLTELSLGYNQLTGNFQDQILKPISNLINLELLDLSFLNISHPIDLNIFASLKSLWDLELSGNLVSPTSLSSNSSIPLNIEALGLSGCNITEFPNILKPLQNLMILEISNNQMKGKVPAWLWKLPYLTTVNLSNNSLNGFQGSPEVLVSSSVEMLFLNLNSFEGPLPNLPISIVAFSAVENHFTGNIPLTICNRNSLMALDLSYNNFSGLIPQCLTNLMTLRLRKNNLQGSIPDAFYVNASLQTLDVGYNRLSGKLPRSLLNCSSLQFLGVDNNRIKDTFPFWLKALPNLKVLTLRSNKLYGSISPPDQGPLAFPELEIFEIADNNFIGSLPPRYFMNWKASSFQKNEYGSMYMNSKTRETESPEVSTFTTFVDLIDLRYKGLSMERSKVQTFYAAIDFSGNRIEGQIPKSIGLLKGLIALNLSNNAFTGHIPLSLSNLTELESLDLSRNQISGTIPNGLKTLSFLAYINVSHNNLKGEIPQGTQITGQPKSSFEGNAGLCGLPLEESCFGIDAPRIQQPQGEDEEEEDQVLSWKGVTIGYGLGVVLGLTIAQVIASYRPELLAKINGPNNCRNP